MFMLNNEPNFDRVMTFYSHKGMDLAKICISKMVYSSASFPGSVLLGYSDNRVLRIGWAGLDRHVLYYYTC